jgi:hypothetical protein
MTKDSVWDERKDCTIRVWVSPSEMRAIKARMDELKLGMYGEYAK